MKRTFGDNLSSADGKNGNAAGRVPGYKSSGFWRSGDTHAGEEWQEWATRRWVSQTKPALVDKLADVFIGGQ